MVTSSTLVVQMTMADAVPLKHTKVKTPITDVDLLGALRDGHIAAFGTVPTKRRLAMGWAQVAHENGQGHIVFNHNLGFIVPKAGTQPYFNLNGKKFPFRHFDTFVDGAQAYWHTVMTCAPAVRAFDAGDPVAAARGLKICRYYEGDETVYAPGMTRLYELAVGKVFEDEQREKDKRELLDAIRRSVEGTPNEVAFEDAGCIQHSPTGVAFIDSGCD